MTLAHATPQRWRSTVPGTMTFPELFRLPATVDLATAARALGIHISTAYRLLRRNAFPCPVLRPGWRYRVPTKALMLVLHIDEIPVRLDEVASGADFATRCNQS